ncbi:MAG: outer membrane beta-barrel protein [Candidatus Aminicenantes bacterium]|nr:outer membrane beta-barrel protein [Candidatus Aminicenantes bacterium]
MRTLKCLLLILVMAVLVLPAANLKVKIKAQKANVRATANISGRVMLQVSAGMIFDVIEKRGVWYKVQLPAKGVNPAQTGFIHGSALTELGEEVAAPRQPRSQSKKAVKSRPLEIKKFKRLSFRGSYFMGFSAETPTSTYTPTIYHEQASFITSYEAKKGNTIDAALGYKFSPALGVEVGGSVASRDVAAAMTAAVPHPLLFGNPRQATGSAGYELKETDLYLNLMYTFTMKSLAIDLFAGPCYVMAETTVVTGYTVTDAYPYTQVNVTYASQAVKKNAFGFDAGIAVGYYFGDTVGLVVSGRFISAKAKFDTATDVPGVEYKLGGLQAGVGLKIKF